MLRTLRVSCLLTLTSLAAVSPANPVPPHRPKPPPSVAPGDYELTWGAMSGQMKLTSEGAYTLAWCGREYAGSWHWEGKTRTLHVRETVDGGLSWSDWNVRCKGDSLEGEGCYTTFSSNPEYQPTKIAVALKWKGKK